VRGGRRGAGFMSAPGRPHAALERALDSLPDGVAIVDPAGQIAYANAAFGKLLGTDGEALRGRSFAGIGAGGGPDLEELAQRVLAARKAELLVALDDGRQALATIRRLEADPASRAGVVVVLRDLAVLDHERQRAGAAGAKPAFRFFSQRHMRADLAHQRRISRNLDQLLTVAERAILQNARVLLVGESGAGKTEIAKYLHDYAGPATAPFVHVNCGSIPETLFESEMFGYERGAFTGALQSGKKGLIEAADGGTLLLDEVGEIPLVMQAKMLKWLETGAVQRVGGAAERAVNVRVIAATNRDLPAMVAGGGFRRDLYYRLAVVPLHVRPLRESRELIGELLDYFAALVNQRREQPLVIDADCRERLLRYSYPGNVRELQNIVQQLSVMATSVAELRHLPEQVMADAGAGAPGAATAAGDLKGLVTAFERNVIRDTIARVGSKRKAAAALGVDIGTIVRKTQAKH
jgi:PAS domain S-box-containing protein